MTTQSGAWATQSQKKHFPTLLIIYEIVAYLSTDMYLPALPSVAQDFQASQAHAQYTLAAWFAGSASLQLILGPVTETYGRKKIMILGAIVFVLASLVCAITSSFPLFLAARFTQGSCVCSVAVAGYGTIHSLYTSKRAIQILALMSSMTILAPALGPFIGSLFVTYASWRKIFGIIAFAGLMCAVALFYFMPETAPITGRLGLKNILAGYMKIMLNGLFLRYVLTFAFLIGGFFLWLAESPFIIIDTYNQSELFYGICQTFVFSGFILGSHITRLAINSWGTSKILKAGLRIVTLACVGVVCSSLFPEAPLYFLVGSMTSYGLGAAMTFGPLNRLCVEASTQPMGKRVAVFSTFVGLSGAGFSFLSTFSKGSPLNGYAIIFVLCVLGALASFSLLGKGRVGQ